MSNPFRLPMLWRSLKNLVTRPSTRRYPAEVRPRPAGARGHVAIEIQSCVYCGLCARKCPCNAIVVVRDERTFSIEHQRCIACGACVDACNKDSLAFAPEANAVQVRGGVVERVQGEKKPDEKKAGQ
jgi:ech hydrogenase subunit F